MRKRKIKWNSEKGEIFALEELCEHCGRQFIYPESPLDVNACVSGTRAFLFRNDLSSMIILKYYRQFWNFLLFLFFCKTVFTYFPPVL
jgi:hypothetical protein